MAMAAALEESEHRFEQLFAKAPAGIALIDPKGKIQECNVALGRLIGREPQALRQVSLFDLVAGSVVAPPEAALAPHGDTTEAGKQIGGASGRASVGQDASSPGDAEPLNQKKAPPEKTN